MFAFCPLSSQISFFLLSLGLFRGIAALLSVSAPSGSLRRERGKKKTRNVGHPAHPPGALWAPHPPGSPPSAPRTLLVPTFSGFGPYLPHFSFFIFSFFIHFSFFLHFFIFYFFIFLIYAEKLCQRKGFLASSKRRRSPAPSPPMCRGLDLLPDWDTPYIRDEFNWCGVCTDAFSAPAVVSMSAPVSVSALHHPTKFRTMRFPQRSFCISQEHLMIASMTWVVHGVSPPSRGGSAPVTIGHPTPCHPLHHEAYAGPRFDE